MLNTSSACMGCRLPPPPPLPQSNPISNYDGFHILHPPTCFVNKGQGANMVVVCGADSVIREITWGGDYKDCVVRDIRLDLNKQVRFQAGRI